MRYEIRRLETCPTEEKVLSDVVASDHRHAEEKWRRNQGADLPECAYPDRPGGVKAVPVEEKSFEGVL